MNFDKTILAQGCVLEGDIGLHRPNDNVAGVGISGGGKSLSLEYPTLLHAEHSSIIATFGKPVEAQKMAAYKKAQGYHVQICNLDNPDEGDVFFDPVQYIESFDDITATSRKIVLSTIQNTKDDYWQLKAIPVSDCLIEGALRTIDNASMPDVLNLFDELTESEHGTGISDRLLGMFRLLKEHDPHCSAVRQFYAFYNLTRRAEKTGSCIVDTLDAAYNTVFPESVRKAMREKPSIDFRKLATEKTALFIICSPVKTSLHHFSNFIYDTAIKVLLSYAQEFEDGKLPRKVRLFFDDFGCTAPIQSFPEHISIFRSAGLSVMLLIQSESMLQTIYGEEKAATILNNCSSYVYFPGGMDRQTCKSVSERMNMPLEDVMYAPVGEVFIMRSGNKPVVKQRYDIFNDPFYQEMVSGISRNSKSRDERSN